MSEPYAYDIAGQQVLMSTLSTPIIENDRFLGVFTVVDFSLAALQKHLATLKPMGAGRVELLSPKGVVLASANAAEIGKPRNDALTPQHAGRDRRRPPFEAIRPRSAGNVRVYVPLRVGDAPQRFALGVVMPHAVIVAEARQLLWLTLLVGVIAALTLSAGVYILLRRLAIRPLAEAVRVAGDVVRRQADSTLPGAQQRRSGRPAGRDAGACAASCRR